MPAFPEFTKLKLSDAQTIYDLTNEFPPYSDYNFISLWSWDTDGERQYSILNGNLVIKFTDYTTNEPFLSFMGTNEVCKTATTILAYCKENNLPEELRLVPDSTAEGLENHFETQEDEDNYDYIFSTTDLCEYAGNQYKSKRHQAAKFAESYPHAIVKTEEPGDDMAQVKVFELLKSWNELKVLEEKDADILNEQSAILRSLKASDNGLNIVLTTVTVGGKSIAFSIDELLPNGYAISHFFKTDHNYTGISEYLNNKLAGNLLEKGVTKWNWEQDLGLESLKRTKQLYRPSECLKKFIVRELQKD